MSAMFKVVMVVAVVALLGCGNLSAGHTSREEKNTIIRNSSEGENLTKDVPCPGPEWPEGVHKQIIENPDGSLVISWYDNGSKETKKQIIPSNVDVNTCVSTEMKSTIEAHRIGKEEIRRRECEGLRAQLKALGENLDKPIDSKKDNGVDSRAGNVRRYYESLCQER